MIVSSDRNPERDLYYLGAKVIEIIEKSDTQSFDYFTLFDALNKKSEISIRLFSLVLDWLFILGVIKNGTDGTIKKCF